MVPIVTRLMPDSSYYGISDLSNTVIQFGSAFAVMGMYDAMYRMFGKLTDKNKWIAQGILLGLLASQQAEPRNETANTGETKSG